METIGSLQLRCFWATPMLLTPDPTPTTPRSLEHLGGPENKGYLVWGSLS